MMEDFAEQSIEPNEQVLLDLEDAILRLQDLLAKLRKVKGQ